MRYTTQNGQVVADYGFGGRPVNGIGVFSASAASQAAAQAVQAEVSEAIARSGAGAGADAGSSSGCQAGWQTVTEAELTALVGPSPPANWWVGNVVQTTPAKPGYYCAKISWINAMQARQGPQLPYGAPVPPSCPAGYEAVDAATAAAYGNQSLVQATTPPSTSRCIPAESVKKKTDLQKNKEQCYEAGGVPAISTRDNTSTMTCKGRGTKQDPWEEWNWGTLYFDGAGKFITSIGNLGVFSASAASQAAAQAVQAEVSEAIARSGAGSGYATSCPPGQQLVRTTAGSFCAPTPSPPTTPPPAYPAPPEGCPPNAASVQTTAGPYCVPGVYSTYAGAAGSGSATGVCPSTEFPKERTRNGKVECCNSDYTVCVPRDSDVAEVVAVSAQPGIMGVGRALLGARNPFTGRRR